jgi:hypothetical protein
LGDRLLEEGESSKTSRDGECEDDNSQASIHKSAPDWRRDGFEATAFRA